MLDGIDYYPKKKKRSFGKLIGLLLFFLALISLWYYLQNLDLNESKSSTIIISQPPEYVEDEKKVVEDSNESIAPKLIESNVESLDEVVSNYEANTQN
tara:strand:+ start:993 stop:1286 length:294 start_codon:yes stop_codon:yes gene_type:complete